MFNKRWREYPYMLQLFLLLGMIFTMMSFSTLIGFLILPNLTDTPLEEVMIVTQESTRGDLNAFIVFQVITNLFSFAGAGFLYAFASHPKPVSYLGLKKRINIAQLLLASVIALAALPLILQLGTWIRMVDLGSYANELQEKSDSVFKVLLNLTTVPELLVGLLAFALIPAFGEELLFRGVVLRFIHKRTRSPHHSVILTALLFAFIHFQPYNLVPIFVMGVLLGYLYYYTGSLWISILVHFVYNGSQILLSYLASVGTISKDVAEQESFPIFILLVAIAIAAGAFYLFKKHLTPLEDGWSDDFTPQELEERTNKNKPY